MSFFDTQIIKLDIVDSTNNYAMELIDGNKAHHGLTVRANSQSDGRGQRGRSWQDTSGNSILMSMILCPKYGLSEQFLFSMSTAVAIAKVLQNMYADWTVNIKWPNDIIINDKKAGGILIENVLRGANWSYAVLGMGLNVNQSAFAVDLPNATSLKISSGIDWDIEYVFNEIRIGILTLLAQNNSNDDIIKAYNNLLFRKGKIQTFSDNIGYWTARIVGVNADGTITLQRESKELHNYQHGQMTWVY